MRYFVSLMVMVSILASVPAMAMFVGQAPAADAETQIPSCSEIPDWLLDVMGDGLAPMPEDNPKKDYSGFPAQGHDDNGLFFATV